MAWTNRLSGLLGGKHIAANIIVVGLPNSGKSTIMTQLKPPKVELDHLSPLIPMGSHAKRFTTNSLTFIAFDLDERGRALGSQWEDFYRDSHAILFVLDSTDRVNLPLVKDQLEKLLANKNLVARDMPIVFLANKMDALGAIASFQLVEILGLKALVVGREWHICSVDALTGEGLNEVFDWLAYKIRHICRQ